MIKRLLNFQKQKKPAEPKIQALRGTAMLSGTGVSFLSKELVCSHAPVDGNLVYKNMFDKCPAGRPGTTDEVANVAELLMSNKGAFITGSTFLADGSATASYFYGPLQP